MSMILKKMKNTYEHLSVIGILIINWILNKLSKINMYLLQTNINNQKQLKIVLTKDFLFYPLTFGVSIYIPT